MSNAGAPLNEIMAVTGHKNKESMKRYLYHRHNDQVYNLSRALETIQSGTNCSSTMTAQIITSKSSINTEKRPSNVDICAMSGSGSGGER